MTDEQTQNPDETPVSELLELAQNKARKLTPRERRRVIEYIDEAGLTDSNGQTKELSNYELADLFDVDEKIVRIDKRKILRKYTEVITPEESMSFVGLYMKGHDALIRKAYAAVQKMESLGMETTLGYLKALQLLSDLKKRRIVMLQEIGAIPKELGNLNTNQELWEAYVLDDGQGNAAHGVRRVAVPKEIVAGDQDEEDEDEDEDGEVFEATVSE